ncbi:MAG: GMC family oxidoreductase, partial [Candidatus Binataceae bacterium]
GLPLPHRTRALLEGARAAGHAPELLDICVYTGPPRNNPHSGLPQSACVYCGNCMLGCHVHAKNTLDLNYLPVAEKNGAEIRPLHEVVMIEPATEGYRIHFKQLNAGSAGAAESGSVIGRKVVVAAGTLGSTELLLRCRDVHRTLPRISNALGSKFSGNGDSLIPATTDLPQAIDAAWGPSITAGFGYSDGADELYIQDLGIPDPFFWTLQAGLPNATRLHNVWRVLKDYIARMLGRPSGKTEGVDFQKLFQGGLLHALPYLGMGTDAADGTIRLINDQVDVDWKRTSSRTMFARMERLLRSLSESMHGRYKPSPLWEWPVRKLLTAHPLGGCAMSDREEDGVVDEFGQVRGYENLIVADGSVIPTALAINPSATISALAERTAAHITSSE